MSSHRPFAALLLLAVAGSAAAATCPPDIDLGSAVGTDLAAGFGVTTTCGELNDFSASLGDDVSCAAGQGSEDVSFLWTAPTTGSYAVDTEGSTYDTALQLRSYVPGSDCGITELACDDDGGTGTQSWIQFSATAGTTYLIIVDGYNAGSCGRFFLNLDAYVCPDGDGDGICDSFDLCQGDDATGDADGDGICSDTDLCFGVDATGDTDGDGTCDSDDLCLGDDTAGDANGDGICDGPTLQLTVGTVTPGQVLPITVDYGTLTGRVFVLVSGNGPGPGPCYPVGFQCVDLIAPLVAGRADTGAGTSVSFSPTVPAWIRAGSPLAFQALLVDRPTDTVGKSTVLIRVAQ